MRTTNYPSKIARISLLAILIVMLVVLFTLAPRDGEALTPGVVRTLIVLTLGIGMIFGYIISLVRFKNKLVSSFGKDIRFSTKESSSFSCELLIKTKGLKMHQVFVVQDSVKQVKENTGSTDLDESVVSEGNLKLLMGDDS